MGFVQSYVTHVVYRVWPISASVTHRHVADDVINDQWCHLLCTLLGSCHKLNPKFGFFKAAVSRKGMWLLFDVTVDENTQHLSYLGMNMHKISKSGPVCGEISTNKSIKQFGVMVIFWICVWEVLSLNVITELCSLTSVSKKTKEKNTHM